MTYTVVAEPAARREWNEAVDWYEEREAGLGLRFNEELQAFLQTLAQDPERYRLAPRLTRKAKMPGPRPYPVYFIVKRENREVRGLAIWHGARNPGA